MLIWYARVTGKGNQTVLTDCCFTQRLHNIFNIINGSQNLNFKKFWGISHEMQFDLRDLMPDHSCLNTFFLFCRSLRPTTRKPPASLNKPPGEEIQEATMSLANANDISVDSAVVAVLEEPVGILAFRKQEHCFNSGK